MTFDQFIKDIGIFREKGYSYSDISMIYNLEFDRHRIRSIFVNKKCNPQALAIISLFKGTYNEDSLKIIKSKKIKGRFYVRY